MLIIAILILFAYNMHQFMEKVLVLKSKKVLVKVFYNIYSEPGHEPGLELESEREPQFGFAPPGVGAGAERNNFGSATRLLEMSPFTEGQKN